MAVAWPNPRPFAEALPWALELERLGVAGFGWGVAWVDEAGCVRGYRHPGTLAADRQGRDHTGGIRSTRFLVHVRRPSKLSTAQLADTQPFVVEDGSFALCHNGYLEDHDRLRPAFRGRLEGGADSEVGFRLFQSFLDGGEAPATALARVHRDLGGRANFGYVGGDGELLVYQGHGGNPMWRFRLGDARVGATALHSDDRSLFALLFTGSTDEERVEGSAASIALPQVR